MTKKEKIVITWSLEQRALKIKVMWQLSITTSYYPVWLLLQHLIPIYLYHKISNTSIYKLEKYSVGCVLGMIKDDKEE